MKHATKLMKMLSVKKVKLIVKINPQIRDDEIQVIGNEVKPRN